MTELMEAPRQRGFKIMTGEILANNHHMLSLVTNPGFNVQISPDDPGIKVATRQLI